MLAYCQRVIINYVDNGSQVFTSAIDWKSNLLKVESIKASEEELVLRCFNILAIHYGALTHNTAQVHFGLWYNHIIKVSK
jgi:hypothetical protein